MNKKNQNYIGVKTLEVLEGADNYNEWIVSQLKPFIKSPALEIGAGIGNISVYFSNLKELVLTDIDESLVDYLSVKYKNAKNVQTEVLNVESQLGKITTFYSTVYSVNVLEHIKDDSKALQNMNRLLKPGGRVVLLVPAKKKAFSKLDKELGHFRRYEKDELVEKLEGANFTVEKIRYFNIVGLLSWVVREKLTRNHKQLKKSHVRMFDMIVPILRRIEPEYIPIGISLIAVARKK